MIQKIEFKVMCWNCDFHCTFQSLEDARKCASKHSYDLCHVTEIKPMGYELFKLEPLVCNIETDEPNEVFNEERLHRLVQQSIKENVKQWLEMSQ